VQEVWEPAGEGTSGKKNPGGRIQGGGVKSPQRKREGARFPSIKNTRLIKERGGEGTTLKRKDDEMRQPSDVWQDPVPYDDGYWET